MRRASRLMVAACLVLGACGGGGPGGDADGVFIAFPRDFEGFPSWIAFDLGDDQDDGVMAVGHRRAYINQLPPTGSSSFPVGTVIVKTIAEADAIPGQVFAMAKRGGTYNSQGTVGWEWFELLKSQTTTPLIRWRGIAPPSGEQYAGVAGGTCNTCHLAGVDNDFVPSGELLLSNF